jgi:hypothetical protein
MWDPVLRNVKVIIGYFGLCDIFDMESSPAKLPPLASPATPATFSLLEAMEFKSYRVSDQWNIEQDSNTVQCNGHQRSS